MSVSRWQNILWPLLALPSSGYSAFMRLRRLAWTLALPRYRPGCPCLSVGNIAWGGTGKTPLIDWLLDWATARTLTPVVLTRGYRADPSVLPLRVGLHHTAREVGDEPYMLFLDHQDCDILVDPQRARAGRYAERSLSPDLLLLDDGFQHLPVDRDGDLVLLRPEDLGADWNRVIPGGCWREGVSALNAATAFCIKATPHQFDTLRPLLQQRLASLHKPVFSFSLEPQGFFDLEGRPAPIRPGEPYLLLTGVGNPQQVFDTVTRFVGYPPEEHIVKPDHYRYTLHDTESVAKRGLPVVSTAKDGAKFRHLPLRGLRILRVRALFGPSLWSPCGFERWLDEWWTKARALDPETGLVCPPLDEPLSPGAEADVTGAAADTVPDGSVADAGTEETDAGVDDVVPDPHGEVAGDGNGGNATENSAEEAPDETPDSGTDEDSQTPASEGEEIPDACLPEAAPDTSNPVAANGTRTDPLADPQNPAYLMEGDEADEGTPARRTPDASDAPLRPPDGYNVACSDVDAPSPVSGVFSNDVHEKLPQNTLGETSGETQTTNAFPV